MITIEDILKLCEEEKIPYKFVGNKSVILYGFSSLHKYSTGNMTWIKKQDAIPKDFYPENATFIIAQTGVNISCNNVLTSMESKKIFFLAIEKLFEDEKKKPPIGHGSYISNNVKLGRNVIIGNNSTLDGNICIGDNTVIGNNVNIENNVDIGNDCTIMSGCSIGQDGYSFTEDVFHYKTMIAHFGGVKIGNNVWIGSNVAIDRGQIDSTFIADGCKIDALCHIAHNVELGKNSAVISLSNLYGSVKTGENVYIATSFIRNQINIGDNVMVGMGSVVVKDINDNDIVLGVPAKSIKKR